MYAGHPHMMTLVLVIAGILPLSTGLIDHACPCCNRQELAQSGAAGEHSCCKEAQKPVSVPHEPCGVRHGAPACPCISSLPDNVVDTSQRAEIPVSKGTPETVTRFYESLPDGNAHLTNPAMCTSGAPPGRVLLHLNQTLLL
jgi:hypothetical protein